MLKYLLLLSCVTVLSYGHVISKYEDFFYVSNIVMRPFYTTRNDVVTTMYHSISDVFYRTDDGYVYCYDYPSEKYYIHPDNKFDGFKGNEGFFLKYTQDSYEVSVGDKMEMETLYFDYSVKKSVIYHANGRDIYVYTATEDGLIHKHKFNPKFISWDYKGYAKPEGTLLDIHATNREFYFLTSDLRNYIIKGSFDDSREDYYIDSLAADISIGKISAYQDDDIAFSSPDRSDFWLNTRNYDITDFLNEDFTDVNMGFVTDMAASTKDYVAVAYGDAKYQYKNNTKHGLVLIIKFKKSYNYDIIGERFNVFVMMPEDEKSARTHQFGKTVSLNDKYFVTAQDRQLYTMSMSAHIKLKDDILYEPTY